MTNLIDTGGPQVAGPPVRPIKDRTPPGSGEPAASRAGGAGIAARFAPENATPPATRADRPWRIDAWHIARADGGYDAARGAWMIMRARGFPDRAVPPAAGSWTDFTGDDPAPLVGHGAGGLLSRHHGLPVAPVFAGVARPDGATAPLRHAPRQRAGAA